MNLLAVSLSVLSTISQSDQKGLSPSKDIALNPGPQEFQSDFLLHGHNNFRHEHATADLAWNTYLVNGSQNWTDNCDFEHSEGDDGEKSSVERIFCKGEDESSTWSYEGERRVEVFSTEERI
ncbi:hypothetical protein FPQ18DRAFT_389979 [Pyronema domesticum]|nr:hypothetical protein FPQ18DRAFT_389979 [Pyronema domesticum]